MAEEEWQIVGLKNDFYRDSFGKVVLLIISILFAIILLAAVSVYLHLNKPPPITFPVDAEWRVQPEVPLDQPYLSTPDLLQWVSGAIMKAFVFDFNYYNEQLKTASQYFTPDGWKVFLNQLNIYANYNNVQAYKSFINATPSGAPFILQQGLLSGRYAWWVQMPIELSYASYTGTTKQTLTLQILVVRVSTLNNLTGVGINNVIVAKTTANQTAAGNG